MKLEICKRLYDINYFFDNCDGLVKINWRKIEINTDSENTVSEWIIDKEKPFKKYEIPSAITFCEGIKSEKKDINSGLEFWWCMNESCFGCTIQGHRNWEDYTMIDFLNIFKYNINEKEYIKFVHFLNRFERLKSHLYCKECGEIMYPAETSIITVHAVTQFKCVNDKCANNKEKIYLNDCLNSRCKAIVDSRISQKCKNDWYICTMCGSCCSHATFENRLKFWQKNSDLTNASSIPPYFLHSRRHLTRT